MLRLVKRSITNKLILLVVATTFIALLAYGAALLAYNTRTYHDTLVKDLATQASIIAEVSAAALEFDDPLTARENLALLRTRPGILRAGIYTPDGELFAEYAGRAMQQLPWPQLPPLIQDYEIDGNRIHVWRHIVKDGRLLGTVYIRASYELSTRFIDYAIILVCVLAASLALATVVAIWLASAVTRPIFAVTDVARQVMQSRDFSLRARKHTNDEIGVLVDAFNDMLSEVERRATALEASNRSLEHEMTERQAAEQALRIADRRKDEFLATLAHELRNPLAPLLNGLHILRLSNADPSTLGTTQAVMERQLKQMVRLVDDLLDVSRITTGKLTISKTRVDIQSVMRDAVESSGGLIAACDHHLRTVLPPEPICVEADPVRLAQVFSNLLNNAAKYTNPGGQITFTAEVENGDAVIRIQDNGIGIAPEMVNEIFHMFTQVDQSLERAHAGLGVGLALSKRLVELHGGSLEVSSEGLGKGSTFTVRLKRAQRDTVQNEARRDEALAPEVKHRVLLVDDNVDYVATMATLLSTLGHDVRTAHDGASALEVARDFKPEFVFMDIGMPGLSGYDVARRMRKQPETAESVLIAVTGWGQENDRQLSREAGFNHHLVKPVELAQVLALIEPPSR